MKMAHDTDIRPCKQCGHIFPWEISKCPKCGTINDLRDLPIVELDFDVVSEPWNRYKLEEGPIIKSKVVLKNITLERNSEGELGYKLDYQNINTIIEVPMVIQGPPSERKFKHEEIEQNATYNELKYSTLSETWNEYIVENGLKIRIKNIVSRVKKTDKFDTKGYPLYVIRNKMVEDIELKNINL